MAYNDFFRLSSHAIITNHEDKILLLKATYCDKQWGLPGGALEPEETIHEALLRECREELGITVNVLYMSGIYFHKAYNSHTCIFKCEMPQDSQIILSEEHSEFRFFSLDELTPIQRHRVIDCLQFDGMVKSAKF